MNVIELNTIEDERLDVYARLTDVQLRSRIEPSKAVFIAESAEVIGRALDAKMQPLSLLTSQKYVPTLETVLDKMTQADPDVAVFMLPGDELCKLTGFELTRGALAAFRRPPEKSASEVLRDARLVVVMEDIRNHTNVGALFRSAAAMGADAVLATPACYDPLYRRAVRVSMGTVFQVPWARIGTNPHDWARDGVALLHDAGFCVVGMALSSNAVALDDPALKASEKIALVFGSEGPGLADTTLRQCDYVARIPMHHGVDSLNVAASSAVALWEFRSVRRGGCGEVPA